jgi:hypothetical protein
MEELMRTGKYEYQSDFAKKYFALVREEGREEDRARGPTPRDARVGVAACGPRCRLARRRCSRRLRQATLDRGF